jgi:hypothetical protein
LCPEHAREMRERLSKYIEHARPEAGSRRRRSRTARSRERSSEIRAWAKQRGYRVSDRGRIPAEAIARYESTH